MLASILILLIYFTILVTVITATIWKKKQRDKNMQELLEELIKFKEKE